MVDRPASYDVFVSYSWSYPRLADRLVAALKARGLTVFQDKAGMADYDEIEPEIRSALLRSRALVGLYTPEFPLSAYCQWELYEALTRAYDLDGHSQRVLAVLHGVDYADVRPRTLARLRLPPPDVPMEVVADSIVAKLAALDERTLGDASQPPQPRWVPHDSPPMPSFVGRAAELWDIHDALFRDEAAVAGGALARVVGLGGVGKSVLVEEYARRFARDHPGGVFVIRAYGGHQHSVKGAALASFRNRQVTEIASRLGLPVDAQTEPAVVDALLRNRLDQVGHAYLWIIDDLPVGVGAKTFRTLLAPSLSGRTLVTTRDDSDHLGGHAVRIGELDARSAVTLMTAGCRVASADRTVVREIAVVDLGGHAQALAVVAGLASGPRFGGWPALRATISAPSPDVLELAAELSPELPGGHEAAIAATLMRSIEQLGAPGTAVLRLASLLSPAPIPHELLTATAVLADGCDASAAESTVGAGLADAARRSLAREASAGATRRWQVHALISRTVRHVDLHEARREHVRAAALSVLITELDKARERAQFQILADYLPHIAEVGRAWRGLDDRYALNEAARAYLELDLNDDAVALYAKLYESCERALGAQDPTTVAVLVGLGAAHGLRGDFDLAFKVKSRAYQTLLATVGPEDPDAITALNNIGIAHLDLRDPEPARRIFAQVYRARRGWNPQHTETIIALGNLAIATQACGRHALALRLKVAAYERMRRLRGDDDPYALEALNNLGAGQLAAGKRAAARATFARVYDGRRRAFGENHPATIGALENLAITEGDVMVLGEVYRRRVLGFDPGGPAALRSLHNLLIGLGGASGAPDPERQPPVAVAAGAVCPDAEVLTPLEDFDANTDRRVALFELAHRGHEAGVASFGPDAPGTMMALCRLAHATAALRQLETQIDDAVMLIDDASDGLRESLGANHPDAVLAERLREWIHQRVDAGTP